MKSKRVVLILAGIVSAAALIMSGCGESDEDGDQNEQNEETSEDADKGNDVISQDDPTDYDAYIRDALAKARGEAPADAATQEGETPDDGAQTEPQKVIFVDKPDSETAETTTAPANSDNSSVVISAADPVTGISDPVEAPYDIEPNVMPQDTITSMPTATPTKAADPNLTPTPKPPATPEDFPVGVCLVYVKGDPDSGYASGIIDRINTIRTEMGYPELVENDGLNKCADMRVREVATFVSHTRPDGTLYNSVAPKYYMAELLAACRTTEEETVDAWVWYPTSRSLIFTTEYTSIGASCFNYNGLDYVVVSMGR